MKILENQLANYAKNRLIVYSTGILLGIIMCFSKEQQILKFNLQKVHPLDFFTLVIQRNFGAMLIILICSYIGYSLQDIVFLANGIVLGILIYTSPIFLILPHPFLELASMLSAGYCGKVLRECKKLTFKCIRFIAFSILLLLIAAIIETFIAVELTEVLFGWNHTE